MLGEPSPGSRYAQHPGNSDPALSAQSNYLLVFGIKGLFSVVSARISARRVGHALSCRSLATLLPSHLCTLSFLYSFMLLFTWILNVKHVVTDHASIASFHPVSALDCIREERNKECVYGAPSRQIRTSVWHFKTKMQITFSTFCKLMGDHTHGLHRMAGKICSQLRTHIALPSESWSATRSLTEG